MPQFTITRKIIAVYLLVTIFSLVAIIYALGSLHTQTARSQHLVSVEFKALNLLRALRQNILVQESLEKQYLILQDPGLLELADRRQSERSDLWQSLLGLDLPIIAASLSSRMERCQEEGAHLRDLLDARSWRKAESFSTKTLAPLRSSLLATLDQLTTTQQETIDASLFDFSTESADAYRVTLLLAFFGIALSAPAALAVILSIHKAVASLVRATKEIAAGEFEHHLDVSGQDEFGQLAREFAHMGRKLRELEQLRLDANPLTHLPGNLAIDRELHARISLGKPFAHMYIDLDNFKAFGDRYGYKAGSEALTLVGDLILAAVAMAGIPEDMVGHIGGDDYVVLTTPEHAEPIAKNLIEHFDRAAPGLYSEEDRTTGYFMGKDRFDVERKFPLLTISIAIIPSDNLEEPSPFSISQECAKMKDHLKGLPGSNYLVNRRKKLQRCPS
jgi:GGDEF domain-containing protein/CHASE3 domain sensor protein